MAEYVIEIWISSAVEFKLRSKHEITGDLVRQALQYPNQTSQIWDDDPEHGWRLQVHGNLETGHSVIAFLHPIDRTLGIWSLATAWKIQQR